MTLVGFIGNILATCFFIDAAWILGMGGINSDPTLMTVKTSDYTYADCMTLIGWGGFIILASGLFDMMDGRLARNMSGKSSLFGALWDSTLPTVTASWSVYSASAWSSSLPTRENGSGWA